MKRARVPNRLSALAVQRLKAPGMYPDGLGLYLQVTPTKDKRSVAKSWIYRFKMPGAKTSREMGLGSLNDVSLQDARQAAQDARKTRAAGGDPLEARRARAAAAAAARAKSITFSVAAERYIAAHSAAWKNAKHREQWGRTIATYASPVIGDLSVQAIDTGLVTKILEPIWSDKIETATRLRGRIEKILDWATARGYRTGENPARWNGHLQTLLAAPSKIAEEEHHPALPFTEIGGFMANLATKKGDSPDALKLLILTATRTSAVRLATWSEIDLAARVWTIPPGRLEAKMKKELRIPLSAPAVALLKRRHKARQDNGLLFPGKDNKPISLNTMRKLVIDMHDAEIKAGRTGYVDPKELDDEGKPRRVTPHGFRSTFRDWAGDETHYPNHVVEMALSHAIGDKVEAAYRRGDLFRKRVALMDDWANYALTPPQKRARRKKTADI